MRITHSFLLVTTSFFLLMAIIIFLITQNQKEKSSSLNELKKQYAGESVDVIKKAFNHDQAWGLCTSIDLHGCKNIMNESAQSEAAIERFVTELCLLINMKKYGPAGIELFGTGAVKGYTLVQLIETSCISAHWADDRMFLDIFSCKFYNPYIAIKFAEDFFQAKDSSFSICIRV